MNEFEPKQPDELKPHERYLRSKGREFVDVKETEPMTQFILKSNPMLYPGQQWDHRASFMAHDQDEADAMAFRWARHHGFDARSVRTTPTVTGWTCDEFMEQFRS